MDQPTASAYISVTASPTGLRWPEGERWRDGDMWLAGGSLLFSTDNPGLRRLVDLTEVGWEPVVVDPVAGLELAATCTLAQLFALAPAADDVREQPEAPRLPTDWAGARLIAPCCRALRGSAKIWNTATVGGNLCFSAPASPMVSLAAALDGEITVWTRDGATIVHPVFDFVTGVQENLLGPGDLVRSLRLPAAALRGRPALRQFSLRNRGRSAVLLAGRHERETGAVVLAVTAATPRPVRLAFAGVPDAAELAAAIDEQVTAVCGYVRDVHGTPGWREHLTHRFAREICEELAAA